MIFESFLTFLGKVFCFTSSVSDKGTFPQPLSPEVERECIAKCKQGDMAAREKLIRHNLRLVAHIVKKYSGAAEADDLISVGSIGLIKGIETFEYGRGSQLATYAAKCIENEILMYIRANKKHRSNVSLSESVGIDKDGNEITLMDILPSGDESVFSRVESDILLERVLQVIDAHLQGREKQIVQMRYGIGYPRAYTQWEIAEQMHISRSYVSRIEKKALGKISDVMHAKE